MRIGLNLLFLKPGIVGGTQTYSENLIRALAGESSSDEFVIFLNYLCRDLFRNLPLNFRRVICGVNGNNRSLRIVYEQTVLPSLANSFCIDVLHSLGQTAPVYVKCPSVITVYDANYWAVSRFFTLHERIFAKTFVWQAVKTSSHILAISEFTKQELIKYLKVKPEKISVIHSGCPDFKRTSINNMDADDTMVMEKYGVTIPFILTVASPWAHKNIAGLISAYRILAEKSPCPPLVVVGRSVENMPQVSAELARIPSCGRVIFTGYVPDELLPVFYRKSLVFAFPSLYEGFGLPVLEAMSFGVPVVSSNLASLPEIAGDAAVLVDPQDPVIFAEAIRRVVNDESFRKSLKTKGMERVRMFSWRDNAEKTLALYHRLSGK